MIYKTINLFGEETNQIINIKNKTNKTLFTDYEAFEGKFETVKTTDDCYTPPAIFQAVLDYVNDNYNLTDKTIIRPFFPDGDYQALDHPKDCIVIDNPPFSIITQIARFYIENNIKFFLFAPHLTLFGAVLDCTRVVANANITYENKANVKTSFLTNIFDKSIGIVTAPTLYEAIEKVNNDQKAKLPAYDYPANVITVSKLAQLTMLGETITIPKNKLHFIRGLDDQKKYKKTLFGSGFLVADSFIPKLKPKPKLIFKLSEKEKELIKILNENTLSK